MDKRLHRTLILDTDPEMLITLQHLLEEAEIDATITWDEAEACQLIETAPFDLILIGDHPPELNAEAIVDDLSLRGTCDLLPVFRTSPSMISDEGKGKRYVEEQAHGSADDRGAEATGSGTQGGRRSAGSGSIEAHDLRLEGEVRRNGREPGARSQAVAR